MAKRNDALLASKIKQAKAGSAKTVEAAKSQLRRLYWATKYGTRSGAKLIAKKINNELAKQGYLKAIELERFATQGASSGQKWSPLKKATVCQRRRQGYGPVPVLVRSGTLLKAATTGKEVADEHGIVLQFKDRAAPKYSGKAGAGRRKKNAAVYQRKKAAAKAKRWKAWKSLGGSGMVSDYAFALNKKRRFLGTPTQAELKPLLEHRDRIIAAVLIAIVTGKRVSEAIR